MSANIITDAELKAEARLLTPSSYDIDLMAKTSDLLINGKYSDFTLRCGAKTYHAHRSIVCLQSIIFAIILCIKSTNKVPLHIDLEHEEKDIVEMMMQFLYRGAYEPSIANTLLRHVKVYEIAEGYNIEGLKDLAAKNYRLQGVVASHEAVIDFVTSLKLIYSQTGRPDSLIKRIALHAGLERMGYLVTDEAWLALLREGGDIGVDFFLALNQATKK